MFGTAFSLLDPASQTLVKALVSQSGVAAGAGDNTELTTAAIDRMPQGLAGFMAALLVLPYRVTQAGATTLKLGLKISESDDGVAFGADEVLEAIATKTLNTGPAAAVDGVYELGIDLSKRKQYIRFKITLDLSAAGVDTFVYGACLVLTGADKLPA